jgi:hypothetical protein
MTEILMMLTTSSSPIGSTDSGHHHLVGDHRLHRGTFRALAPSLRWVSWPDKFKLGPIDKYDASSNLEEFIQFYLTFIEVAGGDDQVKANNLPMALSGAVKLLAVLKPNR